jgi:hypothetical protein
MARIRSIKPDFFTSEKIASLPIFDRLTFIGLWTHVDDNGVCVDNERLITAALWPLEEDPLETLRNVSGALQRLAAKGLIERYETLGRRLIFVAGWDEHQKVSHPSKPRYQRPEDAPHTPTTSTNSTLPKPSGDFPESREKAPEILVPEQGAGSREQGTGSREVEARTRATKRGTRIPDDFAITDTDKAWARENTPDAIPALETAKFVDHWRAKSGAAATKTDWTAAWRNWMRNAQDWSGNRGTGRTGNVVPLAAARPSTTDQRVGAAVALANRFREEDGA